MNDVLEHLEKPAEAFDSSDGRIKEGGEQLPSDPKPHLPHGTLVGLMN